MKFKVGDKVRILSYPNPKREGQIAVINRVYSPGNSFQYSIIIGDTWASSVYETEIEHAVKVGEQLLFPFMKE